MQICIFFPFPQTTNSYEKGNTHCRRDRQTDRHRSREWKKVWKRDRGWARDRDGQSPVGHAQFLTFLFFFFFVGRACSLLSKRASGRSITGKADRQACFMVYFSFHLALGWKEGKKERKKERSRMYAAAKLSCGHSIWCPLPLLSPSMDIILSINQSNWLKSAFWCRLGHCSRKVKEERREEGTRRAEGGRSFAVVGPTLQHTHKKKITKKKLVMIWKAAEIFSPLISIGNIAIDEGGKELDKSDRQFASEIHLQLDAQVD